MSIGRVVICIIVAYIIYSVIYGGLMVGLLGDTYAVNAPLMRGATDPLAMYAYGFHLVQTIAVVLMFNSFVASNDLIRGVKFGLLIGLYLAATDGTFYYSLNMDVSPFPISIIIHLVAGAIVGAALTKLYKAGDGAGATEA